MKDEAKVRVHLIERQGTCDRCGADAFYSSYVCDKESVGYDARFCAECDAWLERACGDAGCEYCRERPDRPSGVPFRVRIAGEPYGA